MSATVDWSAVRDFLYRRPVVPADAADGIVGRPEVLPLAGTREWSKLRDDDPRKLAAVLAAGSRWVLEQELDEIDRRRGALKRAAESVATARDWAAVAKRIRDRDHFYRDHPHLKRKAS